MSRPGLQATFTVSPRADVTRIRWHYDAPSTVGVDRRTGALLVTGGGTSTLAASAPRAWQEAASGSRIPVPVAYQVHTDGTVGFSLGDYDRGSPLVIGTAASGAPAAAAVRFPFSTYLGGRQWDEATGVAVDGAGHTFVTGFTASTNFPTARSRRGFRGGVDAFVSKLSADGRTLLYSTYLGGADLDLASGIDVDDAGNAYVTGRTGSPDFPTVAAWQRTLEGRACQGEPCHDAFVTKIDPSGAVLPYSSYLGGSKNEDGGGIVVGTDGSAYVIGNTDSSDLPTRNALQRTFGSLPCRGDLPCPPDVFVAKIAPLGRALAYSTYLGGSKGDTAGGIAVDASGHAYVTGTTRSADFPTRAARQPRITGRSCGPPPGGPCTDVFVSKLTVGGTGSSTAPITAGGRRRRAAGSPWTGRAAPTSPAAPSRPTSPRSRRFRTRRATPPAPRRSP